MFNDLPSESFTVLFSRAHSLDLSKYSHGEIYDWVGHSSTSTLNLPPKCSNKVQLSSSWMLRGPPRKLAELHHYQVISCLLLPGRPSCSLVAGRERNDPYGTFAVYSSVSATGTLNCASISHWYVASEMQRPSSASGSVKR